MSGLTEIKRRSARIYAEEQEFTNETNIAKKDTTSRPTNMKEVEKVTQIESSSSSKDTKIRRQSVVDLGLDTSIFPKTEEEIEKHSEYFYLTRPPLLESPCGQVIWTTSHLFRLVNYIAINWDPLLICLQSLQLCKLPNLHARPRKMRVPLIMGLSFQVRSIGLAGQRIKIFLILNPST